MPDNIELFGIYVFTHGWQRILTVMSPTGATAVRKAIAGSDGVELNWETGRLVQLREKRAGALDRVVLANNIRILSKADWDASKVRFGDGIYR